MKKTIKAGLMLLSLSFAAGSLQAAPIEGNFTLLADGSSGVAVGTVIGSGSFVTADVSVPANVQTPYTTDAGDLIPNAVLLTSFDLTNTNTGQIYDINSFASANEPVAVLAGPTSTTVQFIFGTAIIGNETLVLSFDQADPAQGTFLTGTSIANAISGNQVIPEPGALALFGAGLIAFGSAGALRKKRS